MPASTSISTIAVVLTAGVVLFTASCGTASDSATPAATTASSAGAEGEGAALYASNCASCHGADLRGTDKGPSHLSIVYEPGHHGDDSFRSAIVNGARQHHWDFGDMAAIPGLDDDEIEAIIEYVRDEQQRLGFER